MGFERACFEQVRLGDVAKFRAGSVFKPDEQGQRSGDIPFIKVSDLNLPSNFYKIVEANNWLSFDAAKRLRTTIHPAGATVFAKIGIALTYNRRRLLVRDTAIDNNLMSATPDRSRVRPDFLYYTLRCLDFNEIAKGSALPYINMGDLQSLPIRLPPRSEQAGICAVLGGLDDRIDLLRQTNATLEAIAQALFKSWFVDFDPVHAKAEGRARQDGERSGQPRKPQASGLPRPEAEAGAGAEGAPEAMDAATAALFTSEFEQSELGLIPQGWAVKPFDTQFDFTMGQSPPGSTYNSDQVGMPFFQGCTDFGDVFPTERIYCSAPTRFAQAGDVLMSVRAPVGALNIATFECSIGRGLCGVRHKSRSTALTYFFLQACIKRIESAAGEGALFRSLSKKQLANLPVLVPNELVTSNFIAIIEPIMDRMIMAAQQADRLSQLRDTLLPRLISGKLRLPEATEAVEEALI